MFFAPSGQDDGASRNWKGLLAGWVPALSLLALVFYFSFHQLAYQWNWPSVYNYRSNLLSGWLVTIAISLVSLLLSTLIGLVFALVRRSRLLPLRNFGHLYVELVRGTPLLVQILVFFYVVADAFRVENRYVAGVLILSFFSGAYISEVIRAGLQSVEPIATRIGPGHRPDARPDLPLRDSAAGLAPDPAAAGRPVRLSDQRLVAPLDHRRQRVHAGRPRCQLGHLQHAGMLPAAGRRLPGADAAAVALAAQSGKEASL